MELVEYGWSDDEGTAWGKKTGPKPTDRGELGVKRSLLSDGRGAPIGLAIDGANRQDMKQVLETIESLVALRPVATEDHPPGMCLDKGYDYVAVVL